MTAFVTGASRMLSAMDSSSQDDAVLVWSRASGINPSVQGDDDVPEGGKTLAQTYYEEVEALKANGMSNADAIKQVAAKRGKKEGAIRGSLHQYKTKLNGGGSTGRRGRRPATQSVDDYLSTAREALRQALALIDSEVDDANAALDAAQARYDTVVAGVKDRKAELERKLQALA